MKLQINREEVLVDFSYSRSTRTIRKNEIINQVNKTISKLGSPYPSTIPIVETICTITLHSGCVVVESVKCDLSKHNREFARKYSLKKALARFDKDFRTEVWKKYFEYIAKDKVEYLGINGFGFQNINGIITIDSRDKEVVLTSEQKQLLLKLLK